MVENHPFNHARIAGAMAAALLAVELIGFSLFNVSFRFYDLASALALAAGIVAFYSLIVWPVFRAFKLHKETALRATSLVGSLAMLGMALTIWLHQSYLGPAPAAIEMASVLVIFILLATLGAILWGYLSRGDPHLGNIRFRALAPVTVISVSIYSIAGQALFKAQYRAMAVFGILAFFIIAYYLLIRLMWRGRRKLLERWGVPIHVSVIAAVIIVTAAGAGKTYYNNSRPAAAPAGSPPVVFISIDTLRADYLSCYDQKAPKTPAMDSIAKDGIRFKHAVAPSSWTPPSVASFLTGLSPTACGAGTPIADIPNTYTGPLLSARTIAEVFHETGYNTSALVYNRFLEKSKGFGQGFDHHEMLRGKKQRPRFLLTRNFNYLEKGFRKKWEGPAEGQTARAIEILEQRAPGPFFLWLHYMDPHLPYYEHEKYKPTVSPGPMTHYLALEKTSVNIRAEIFGLREQDKEYLRQRYAGEVRFTDEQLGRLFQWLKENRLYKKSIIVITSDHGEEFWEHGSFAHAHSFHKEIVEVPLIVKLPENRHAGQTVDHWADLKRIGATMMDAAGIKAEFPGKSLLNDLSGNHPKPADPIERFWISENVLYGLEQGAIVNSNGHKAIFHGDGSVTCYDLSRDPDEQNPRHLKDCPWPEDVPSPRKIFLSIQERDFKKFKELGGEKADRGEVPQDNLKKLKAMGYF